MKVTGMIISYIHYPEPKRDNMHKTVKLVGFFLTGDIGNECTLPSKSPFSGSLFFDVLTHHAWLTGWQLP